MKTKVKKQIVGKILNKNIKEEDIRKITGLSMIRFWKDDSVGTCDFSMDRLNVYLDDNNLILNLTVG